MTRKPNKSVGRWSPPVELHEALDKIVTHNRDNPGSRIGARKTADWLEQYGVTVGKDAVHRWLKERSKKLEDK